VWPSARSADSVVPEKASSGRGLSVAIPGRRRAFRIDHVVFDFNGTLAGEGKLVSGVARRIRRLASLVDVVVMTADTFGTAPVVLGNLPVTCHVVVGGKEKRRIVELLGGARVAAVGNGVNDVPMFEAAALGIAVCGIEGMASALLREATIVVININDAIDLLLDPRRLVATLRR